MAADVVESAQIDFLLVVISEGVGLVKWRLAGGESDCEARSTAISVG
jgi:hypothetical protein